MKLLVGRIKLLRLIYPYLKVLKDNPYISERKITNNRFDDIDLPSEYYTYRFNFTPFKEESKTNIRIELAVDFFTDKVIISTIREMGPKANKINFLSYLLFGDDKEKNIDIKHFEDRINNIHTYAVETLYNDNSILPFLESVKMFIPDDVLFTDDKIAKLYKSVSGINKFNL